MDGRLVRECHNTEITALQLAHLRPEPYPLPVLLHLLSLGCLDHSDAHLFCEVWTLRQHLRLEVFSKGVVHR